ncbi:MAG: hypothetical protein M1838_005454, partial [Thelocarpon superellum]
RRSPILIHDNPCTFHFLMNDTVCFPPGFGWRDVISAGNAGLMVDLDAVMKIPVRKKDQCFIDMEKQVYERLANEHTRVLR